MSAEIGAAGNTANNIDIQAVNAVLAKKSFAWAIPLLNDARDVEFVRLMSGCLLVVAAGIGLFFAGERTLWLAPVYWVMLGALFLDRFILMLHCTSHRPLFKHRYRALNQIIPWVLGPFFGETPESYFTHHMGMHHPENNLKTDLSTTLGYRRDRFSHWLHYLITFQITGLITLFMYHWRKGNKKMFQRLLVGEGSWYLAVIALCFFNWQATLAVLVVPMLLVRTLMMAGNWAQHAFVDTADPGNAYKNSITCINSRYNRRCFNDGYHILHHIKARTHFTEYPAEFEQNRAEYGRQDAVVFEGVDFFEVWLLLMVGAWGTLAKRFVRLPGAPQRTDEEVIAFLKSRMNPAPAEALA